jgi:hypothetical protein
MLSNRVGKRGATVTRSDVRRELGRLRESKVLLVSLAERLGVAAPRHCCRHRGENACLDCASAWLLHRIRIGKPLASVSLPRRVRE